MKKILFALLICFCIITKFAYAGTCNGGVEFQGAVNGHTYCRSKATMNWWTAFGWCKKQGRELASIDQLCDNWNGVTSDTICPNMKLESEMTVWSSNPNGSSFVFLVSLKFGNIDARLTHFTRRDKLPAVCY